MIFKFCLVICITACYSTGLHANAEMKSFIWGTNVSALRNSFSQTVSNRDDLTQKHNQTGYNLTGFLSWFPFSFFEWKAMVSYSAPISQDQNNVRQTYTDWISTYNFVIPVTNFFAVKAGGESAIYQMSSTATSLGYKDIRGDHLFVESTLYVPSFTIGRFSFLARGSLASNLRNFREFHFAFQWDLTWVKNSNFDYYPYRYLTSLVTLNFEFTERKFTWYDFGFDISYRRKDFLMGLHIRF